MYQRAEVVADMTSFINRDCGTASVLGTGHAIDQSDIRRSQLQFEMVRMKSKSNEGIDRRERQRFSISAPLTLFLGDREVSAYTRDLSNRGVYFYLALSDSKLLDCDFEFVVELPPEITLSSCCRIRCVGRAVRREENQPNLAGVAAEIFQYSILRDFAPAV
jgi:PilZ domain